jgi:hypothetical protein
MGRPRLHAPRCCGTPCAAQRSMRATPQRTNTPAPVHGACRAAAAGASPMLWPCCAASTACPCTFTVSALTATAACVMCMPFCIMSNSGWWAAPCMQYVPMHARQAASSQEPGGRLCLLPHAAAAATGPLPRRLQTRRTLAKQLPRAWATTGRTEWMARPKRSACLGAAQPPHNAVMQHSRRLHSVCVQGVGEAARVHMRGQGVACSTSSHASAGRSRTKGYLSH